ncbi:MULTISPECIES: mechanosensitive ion channel domain-containing protein [unclassified Roseibium]|uniref:mechanosensitive ion channel domain-containing protein n=1 Tax=unclassified Roseibium TaxID=2629323 RepID=UPI00273D4B0C|nr:MULTISPECIES: mechanosensitive ion channel domain-containing protein [unclassified Roseibium]
MTANGQEQDVGGGKQGLPGRRTQGERPGARGRTDRLGLLSPALPAFSPGPGSGRIARAQKPLRFSGRKFQVFARQIGLLIIFICVSVIPGQAQTDGSNATEPTALIETERTIGEDRSITTRLQAIFREIEALSGVQVRVNEGVVVLSGAAANDSAADRAVELATRLQGAVAVEDRIDRTLSVEDNLDPFLQRTENTVDAVIKAWPLYAIAALAFIGVSLTAHLIASAHVVWRFFAPNPFIGDLISQSIRFFGILAGLLLALSILDAMALFGAAAGSAGLIGLAVGFAVKDTIENYVASLMLSVRQPFRADDHVVINDMEGIVVRLTSRATILMTLDGNHLRIPNAEVFKGIILNYTRNPQRRMTFDLGVDADDDPIDATAAGLETMKSLDFLLDDPKPIAFIEEVGDSNIVITFAAWIDQTRTDFLKARSAAINAVKTILEDQGFTLPEPIYRVRLEGSDGGFLPAAQPQQEAGRLPKRPRPPKPMVPDHIDVSQDDDVRRQVAEERARGDQEDLLSDVRPIE